MTATSYPNGIGGTLGDSFTIGGPLYTSGQVFYCDFTSGNNANAGTNRELPKKTIASAISACADNDIIVLINNHTEVLAATLTINKKVMIVAEGLSSGVPTASISTALASYIVNINVANVQLRGIKFIVTGAAALSFISVSGAYFRMEGCYLEAEGASVSMLELTTGADGATLLNNTFIIPTDSLGAPASGFRTGASVADLTMRGNTFSTGGSYYSTGYAMDLTLGTHARLMIDSLNLLLGADVFISSASTGYLKLGTVTGSSKVVW